MSPALFVLNQSVNILAPVAVAPYSIWMLILSPTGNAGELSIVYPCPELPTQKYVRQSAALLIAGDALSLWLQSVKKVL